MIRLAALLTLLLPALRPEDTHRATLVFETMHCDECRAEIEAILRKVEGFKSVAVEGDRVTLVFEDKAPIPSFRRLPGDLRLKEVLVEISGTVSFAEDKATLVAKGSGAALALVNPEKQDPPADRLAELRRQLGGKNRFRIRGALQGARTVVLASFERTDWKDE